MQKSHRAGLGVAALCSLVAQSLLGQEPDSRLRLEYTVAPNIFQTGQNPNVQISLTQTNGEASETLRTNDRFVFRFDIPGGAVTTIDPIPVLKSEGLLPSDFRVVRGPDHNQVTVTYIGTGAKFPRGEGLTIKDNVWTSTVGSGKLTMAVPDERYSTPALPLTANLVTGAPSSGGVGTLSTADGCTTTLSPSGLYTCSAAPSSGTIAAGSWVSINIPSPPASAPAWISWGCN